MGPETSMEVQAALGSDIALVFDECTPFHGGRDYTARSTERTHRWLDRCLDWHGEHGPEGQVVYGIVQGGVEEDLRRASAQEVAARPVDGDRDRRHARRGQGPDVRGRRLGDLRARRRAARGTCSGSARSTTSCAAWSSASTRSTARCRRGSAATAMAIVPDPEHRWRVDLAKGRFRGVRRAAARRLPVPGVRHGYTRALPALPAEGARADGAAPADDPQPRLRAAADGRAARRDRRRAAGRGGRRRAGRRGAVGAGGAGVERQLRWVGKRVSAGGCEGA